MNFNNSLDMFKELTQVEHLRILHFVFDNSLVLEQYTKEEECIEEYYRRFCLGPRSPLDELQIKAAIYAAYIRIIQQ
jgi:hypothetical protein